MIAREMAGWCLHTGQSPDAYRSLNQLERDAFTQVQNDHNRRANSGR